MSLWYAINMRPKATCLMTWCRFKGQIIPFNHPYKDDKLIILSEADLHEMKDSSETVQELKDKLKAWEEKVRCV